MRDLTTTSSLCIIFSSISQDDQSCALYFAIWFLSILRHSNKKQISNKKVLNKLCNYYSFLFCIYPHCSIIPYTSEPPIQINLTLPDLLHPSHTLPSHVQFPKLFPNSDIPSCNLCRRPISQIINYTLETQTTPKVFSTLLQAVENTALPQNLLLYSVSPKCKGANLFLLQNLLVGHRLWAIAEPPLCTKKN